MNYIEKINIIKFLSEPKRTPFAPEWLYFLGETFILNIDFKKIEKFLLKKEKEILKLPQTTRDNKSIDGYTGLGPNSTTARFDQYNILSFNNSEIKKLKKAIIEMHNKFLQDLKIEKPKSLFAQCWVNIMRKGQQIKLHIHGTSPDCYLGGHICIKCNNTATHYINPQNQINEPSTFRSPNKVGKITLFQNCIPHYTDIHISDEERITIAFDLNIINLTKNQIQLY